MLIVDQATSAEHLYVGMTRGRHHNLACVIAERPGDEHTPQNQPPTGPEVLTAVLWRTSTEKSATETIRDELDHLQPAAARARQKAIIEGLRQAEQHSHNYLLRQNASRQPKRHPTPSTAPTAAVRNTTGHDL